MIASIVVFAASCTKDETSVTPPPATSGNSNNPPVAVIGSITDMGAVATNLRLMQVTVNSPGNLYDNASGDFISKVNQIVLNFYSASDGIIPAGTYNFSNSDVKQPFTFDTGILTLQKGTVKSSSIGNNISDGSITVTQNGPDYLFIFSCTLNTGELFTGSSSGGTLYSDIASK